MPARLFFPRGRTCRSTACRHCPDLRLLRPRLQHPGGFTPTLFPRSTMDLKAQVQQLLALPPAEEQHRRHAQVRAAAGGLCLRGCDYRTCGEAATRREGAPFLLPPLLALPPPPPPLPAPAESASAASLLPLAADRGSGRGGSAGCGRWQGQGHFHHAGAATGFCMQMDLALESRPSSGSACEQRYTMPAIQCLTPAPFCAECRPSSQVICYSRSHHWRPSSTLRTGRVSGPGRVFVWVVFPVFLPLLLGLMNQTVLLLLTATSLPTNQPVAWVCGHCFHFLGSVEQQVAHQVAAARAAALEGSGAEASGDDDASSGGNSMQLEAALGLEEAQVEALADGMLRLPHTDAVPLPASVSELNRRCGVADEWLACRGVLAGRHIEPILAEYLPSTTCYMQSPHRCLAPAAALKRVTAAPPVPLQHGSSITSCCAPALTGRAVPQVQQAATRARHPQQQLPAATGSSSRSSRQHCGSFCITQTQPTTFSAWLLWWWPAHCWRPRGSWTVGLGKRQAAPEAAAAAALSQMPMPAGGHCWRRGRRLRLGTRGCGGSAPLHPPRLQQVSEGGCCLGSAPDFGLQGGYHAVCST